MIKVKRLTYSGIATYGGMSTGLWSNQDMEVMLYIDGSYIRLGTPRSRLRYQYHNVVVMTDLEKYPVMSRCVLFQRIGGISDFSFEPSKCSNVRLTQI